MFRFAVFAIAAIAALSAVNAKLVAPKPDKDGLYSCKDIDESYIQDRGAVQDVTFRCKTNPQCMLVSQGGKKRPRCKAMRDEKLERCTGTKADFSDRAGCEASSKCVWCPDCRRGERNPGRQMPRRGLCVRPPTSHIDYDDLDYDYDDVCAQINAWMQGQRDAANRTMKAACKASGTCSSVLGGRGYCRARVSACARFGAATRT